MIYKIVNKFAQLCCFIGTYFVPVNKNLLLFGTYNGFYNDNARFLAEYIHENYDYRIYWIGEVYSHDMPDGMFVKRGTIKAFLLSIKASHIFFTHSQRDVSLFYNRKTVLVNLWHGSPTKKIGLDHKVFKNINMNPLRKIIKKDYETWDYFIVSSYFWVDVFRSAFRFEPSTMLVTGLPRTDYLTGKNQRVDLRETLCDGLIVDKVLLYIPTYRKGNINNTTYEIVSNNIYEEFLSDSELHSVLEKNKYLLVFKPHPMEVISLNVKSNRICVLDEFNGLIEDLYLISDAMITDYSSAIFDYANLNKSIVLYTPDYLEMGRCIDGFYFDYDSCGDFAGFNIARDKNQVLKAIRELSSEIDEEFYLDFNRKFSLRNASRSICKRLSL